MKSITLLLALLAALSLACGMAVPVEAPAPVFTATPRPIPTYSEPLDYVNTHLEAETCTLVAETNTNVRECASVSCANMGLWIYKGEIIMAACNQDWALVVVDGRAGYVCIAALAGTGGCE